MAGFCIRKCVEEPLCLGCWRKISRLLGGFRNVKNCLGCFRLSEFHVTDPADKLGYRFSSRLGRLFPDPAFPYHLAMPTQLFQLDFNTLVPCPIRIDLGSPELRPGFWQPEQVAVMAVPEAPVDEDHCPVFGQHDIRAAGQAGAPKAVAEAEGMEAAADLQLDLRVFPSDPRHQRGTLFRADDVHAQGEAFTTFLRFGSVAGRPVAGRSRCGTISRATSLITGTTTELPNCL